MEIWLWASFFVMIVGLLLLDVGLLHRTPKVISTREALLWTCFWILLALIFNGFIYFLYQHHWFEMGLRNGIPVIDGSKASLEFFAGYIIEKSLSLDNIVVIALVFSYFSVPLVNQHRVLFWGIMGVLILRFIMILGGVALVSKFYWINYIFGGFLIFTAVKMLTVSHDNIHPEHNVFVRIAKRFFAVTPKFHEDHFFVKLNGVWHLTPLFIVLIVIESTDVLFAIDSIPAIFAVTKEPFIVFTSNIFAVLGLRSLYFALAGMMDKFRYLKASLAFLMAFVGVKMILEHHYEISLVASLFVIIGILSIGVLASIFYQDTVPLASPLKKPTKKKN